MSEKRSREKRSQNYETAEIHRLKDYRKKITDREKRKQIAVQHNQNIQDFRQWKVELKRIIEEQSRMELNSDGTVKFILPTKLVQLVWRTTIEQKIAYEMQSCSDVKQAASTAMDKLREEVTVLAGKFEKVLTKVESK